MPYVCVAAAVQNQTLVVVRLQLGMPFDAEWTAHNGMAVRSAVASEALADASKVQLVSAGGTDSVVTDVR